MTRRRAAMLSTAVLLAVAAACGVDAESVPEPLPSIDPVVLPPSVTQEPAAPTPDPPPSPEPRAPSTSSPPR